MSAVENVIAELDRQVAALTAERDEFVDIARRALETIEAIAVKGLGYPPVAEGPMPREWENGGLWSDEVRAIREERDQLRAALKDVEWKGVYVGACPCCIERQLDGHAPNCIVWLALRKSAGTSPSPPSERALAPDCSNPKESSGG